MAAALTLLRYGETQRDIYLFDTFEGMSAPTEFDRLVGPGFAAEQLLKNAESSVWAYVPLEQVYGNVLSVGYLRKKIHFIKGKVEDTLPGYAPSQVAVLRLDTDWYESTLHELVHLYPQLAPQGVHRRRLRGLGRF